MKKTLIAVLLTLFLIVGCAPSQEADQEAQTQPSGDTDREPTPTKALVSEGQILHTGMYTDQSKNLWSINSDGSGLEKKLSKYVEAKWSPDNKWILYYFGGKLMKMTPDAKSRSEIAGINDVMGYFDYTPDGRYILWEEGQNIHSIEISSGIEKMPLVEGKSPAYPEKDTAAYLFENKIFKIDLPEGEETEEWLDLKDPKALKASPDGLYLSFSNDGAFWIAPDEKRTSDLTEIAGSVITNYEWSPNSKKIAYAMGTKLYIYDIASDATKTVDKKIEGPMSWSRDSKWLAFTHRAAETYEDIWFVEADGTGLKQFTECSTACELLDWSN
jgi:Tol biopolymer transport system component